MKIRTSCMLAILGLLILDTAVAGKIDFAEKWDSVNGPGGDRCSIDIEASEKTQIFDFKGDNNDCKNDQMTYFKLDSVPSATLIGLYAEAKCRTYNKPDWYFILRVNINPVSTKWIAIPDLMNVAPDRIVERGVRRDDYDYNQGNIKGKLSCVSIHLY
ncbi:hypothetical protein K4A76_16875 [Pseudomonas sp. NEEL19]|uniref:hypothetical protein n=1 Tax=Pseudomonas sp. NEEL19 TaxID=2867409 RepID=UPI00236753C9|nr:hypothetical protein [Pseudomonas sp. NEEL19]WDM58123.1 hypothetical protein K4A76_16875 [Pseudomonas sp. NEEL19]